MTTTSQKWARTAALAVASAVGLALVGSAGGCSGEAPEAPTENTDSSAASALLAAAAISRAEEWVDAKLHYCQSANHARDYDSACSTYCERKDNPEWDAYRSDCSGLTSWAWELPAPGRVTTEFAPYQNDITHTISASDLEPGDAVNNTEHVMIFKGWNVKDHEATFLEEPGCSSATPYAHQFTSSVTVSGDEIYVAWNGMTFHSIRFNKMTEAPGKPIEKTPPKPADCGVIHDGQGLAQGEEIKSCDGRFRLTLQTDGNLVLYENNKALWATGTNGKDGYALWMQNDGNLVLYSPNGSPLWASNTHGHNGATASLQTDGNLVVYEGKSPLWASHTSGH